MHKKKMALFVLLTLLVTLVATQAFAFQAPAAGDFGFEAYDFLIKKLLQGPMGAIAGVLAVIAGVALLIQQKMVPAIVCILGGVVVFNVGTIVTAVGALI